MGPSTWATIRDFLAAARAALYRDSGTRDVCDLEKPWMFLATWRDLTVITRLGLISYPMYSLGWTTFAL